MSPVHSPIDLDRLFRLRLVVARYGEMDVAKWWNTEGMLGQYGQKVLRRGFPATHRFAQARVVFAVAKSRCREIFDPPGGITLWSLLPELEEAFDEEWQTWLDDQDTWNDFFDEVASIENRDLMETLRDFDLLSAEQHELSSRLRRSAEGRAVPVPGTPELNDDLLTLLAAGFGRGEVANPAVPYARIEE